MTTLMIMIISNIIMFGDFVVVNWKPKKKKNDVNMSEYRPMSIWNIYNFLTYVWLVKIDLLCSAQSLRFGEVIFMCGMWEMKRYHLIAYAKRWQMVVCVPPPFYGGEYIYERTIFKVFWKFERSVKDCEILIWS